MNIRPATEADAKACRGIYAPFVAESWVSFEEEIPSASEMMRRIAASGESHAWLVADLGGEIAGYAYGSLHRSRGAYNSSCDVAVYVDPDHQRGGIGLALYEALLPVLKDRGFHAAFAGIALPNEASVALHQKAGFTSIGIYREVGWKLGGWRDVEWWQRLL